MKEKCYIPITNSSIFSISIKNSNCRNDFISEKSFNLLITFNNYIIIVIIFNL